MSTPTVAGNVGNSEWEAPAVPVRIINKDEHPITPDQIDPDALFILQKLNSAGFSAYLVGGGVRDLYLGKKPKDFDISTDARPGQLRRLFPNSNTIGRRFRLVQVFFRGGKTIEVSTLRSLSEHDLDGPEAVLAPNNTYGTLSEDARRRDLTINSLFFEIENNTIIDYLDGSGDLDRAVIRIIGDPAKRISRDPVRMMRAIRHAARNNFKIEQDSWQAICQNCDKLKLCPPSRLRDELLKDYYSGAAAPWFELAFDSGLFFALLPVYRKAFNKSSDQGLVIRDLLLKIFKTIDRINNYSVENHIHRQPDYFLFALSLIPWAEARWQLLSQPQKSAQLFHTGKQIREELDRGIGVDLNLRRSMRQDMANLLTNLSLLANSRQPRGWPKWLKKKSYFPRARLFYQFYNEAASGREIAPHFLHPSIPKPQISVETAQPPETDSQQRKDDSPQVRPAFAKKTKGGVFGFRK